MSAIHRRYFVLEKERGYVANIFDVIIDRYALCKYLLLALVAVVFVFVVQKR